MMAGIRGADTKPEMLLRKGLHALGWRYRLHGQKLPGKPDLVFAGRRALVFAHGCFWHGHDCHLFKWPKTREEFWATKIGSNITRDMRVRQSLLGDGWRVLEVWECQLKGRTRQPLEDVLMSCDAFLRGDETFLSIGEDRHVPVPDPLKPESR
ncbi:very short patch repair endonuclease [Novosphingobium terrae]|uniref:very short patch repair endonuclease n=1 Tax=Novosphingobium terrae TaxID=2726189 RepID=UPI001F129A06|nr:very short patch repair endonuclease [Novosphingobium terrae]